jgi:integrase
MSLKPQPLLTLEVENQLKVEMFPLWDKLIKGPEIARKLQFGVEGSPYEKIKPEYIYYFRQKFNTSKYNSDGKTENEFFGKFPPRKRPSFAQGEMRYKVHPDELGLITQAEFIKQLNKKVPLPGKNVWWQDSYTTKRTRAYLILHFYTPLRSSEIRERDIRDFELTDKYLIIHLLRKKKKKHKKDDEPIEIPLNWKLMDELIDWIQPKRKDETQYKKWVELNIKGEVIKYNKPFGFSSTTARNYVKKVFKNRFPHNFRFIWITDKINKFPKVRVEHIRAKTHLTLPAIEAYVLTEKKKARELDEIMTEDYS